MEGLYLPEGSWQREIEPQLLAAVRGGACSFLHKAPWTLESACWEKGFRHTRLLPKSVAVAAASRALSPALETEVEGVPFRSNFRVQAVPISASGLRGAKSLVVRQM